MPLARIDLRKGKTAAYRQQVGQVVYDAMLSIGVPKDDRFQIIQEHEPDGLIYDPGYLGIARTDDFICIQVTWNEGRTLEQKKAFYSAVAHGLHDAERIYLEDVFINLVEVKRKISSFGNGLAQYAT